MGLDSVGWMLSMLDDGDGSTRPRLEGVSRDYVGRGAWKSKKIFLANHCRITRNVFNCFFRTKLQN